MHPSRINQKRTDSEPSMGRFAQNFIAKDDVPLSPASKAK
jgi:hypothetical protein